MSIKNKNKITFLKVIRFLKEIVKDGDNLTHKAISLGLQEKYFNDYKRKRIPFLVNNGIITREEYEEFDKLYLEAKNCCGISNKKSKTHVTKRLSNVVKPYGVEVRDNNDIIIVDNNPIGRISHYEYCISDRYGEPIHGILSRTQMEQIYSYYSSYGANLTRKTLALELCNELDITSDLLQKILNVFNITKSSIPLPKHLLEEETINNNVEHSVRIREREIHKKIDEGKYKYIEQQYKTLLLENQNLKEQIQFKDEWLSKIDFSNVEPYIITQHQLPTKHQALVIYLSDMHIGAMVEDDSLYNNKYDKTEVYNRLEKILNRVSNIVANSKENFRFDRIIVCNLGDSLDGFNGQTTRGGHGLSQNMNNKEQFNTFIEVMKWFFHELHQFDYANHIDYYAVGASNHDGDFGYCANKLLEEYFTVKYPKMTIQVFEKIIDYFEYGKHTVCITHGKDTKEMFKNMPLNLDDRTENFINEFLDSNNIYNSIIHFVKGDLHQCSLNYGKRFRYKNVGSLFGSSKWIHHNFGNTKAMCDMDILSYDTTDVMEIRLPLN